VDPVARAAEVAAEVMAAAAVAAARPTHVGSEVAKALRVYDAFPGLPEPMRAAGAEHVVVVDVCVSDAGAVSDVVITRGAAAALDSTLRATIRTWRYRPLFVSGAPMPFCHTVQIDYRM
jgi:protein TonB